jgi:hypothetical protein
MITRRRISTYILAVTAAFVVAAAGPAPAKTSIKDEIDIGQKAANEIEKEFPITDNKAWSDEITKMGKSLIVNVKRKDIPYTFRIIKEQVKGVNEVDAFSLPGGPVYMSERIWRLLTKDERIGVLSHEIAHVDKRHAIDTMSEMQKRSMWATAILIISGATNNWWDAADIGNTLYTLKYSRKRETEADMMGVDLSRAAGYNPGGLVTALEKILHLEQENGTESLKILSTHPQTKDRVKYLTKRCLELGLKPEDLKVKFVDQPDRLGNVVGKTKDGKGITVSTTRDLAANETVWIKKPLWDDASKSVIPMPVAKGTANASGKKSELSVKMEPGFEFVDIEQGDGIYPQTPQPAKAK